MIGGEPDTIEFRSFPKNESRHIHVDLSRNTIDWITGVRAWYAGYNACMNGEKDERSQSLAWYRSGFHENQYEEWIAGWKAAEIKTCEPIIVNA